MDMLENGSDRQEAFQRALTTLGRFLPTHYQKDSVVNILLGAIDYIEILSKSLAEPKGHATADALVQYSTVTNLELDFTNLTSMSCLDDISVLMEKDLNCIFDEDTFTDAEPYQSVQLPFEEQEIESKRCEIKRPPNGFIRFSADKRREMHLMFPNTDNREISKFLGQRWQQMSHEEKSYYVEAFYTDMNTIKSRFPEWNYAASRAKSAVQTMAEQVMLPTRLRPRQILDFKAYEQTEVLEEEENTTKKKTSKKNKKKPISLADKEAEAVLWVQCDLCKKWRKLPHNFDAQDLPKTWWCSMNPNVFFSKCSIPQEK